MRASSLIFFLFLFLIGFLLTGSELSAGELRVTTDKTFCAICHKSLTRPCCYSFPEGDFCDKCLPKYLKCPVCFFCKRKIMTGGNQLPDGRFACKNCAQTEVLDINTAIQIMREVIDITESELQMKPRKDCTVVLADRTNMTSIMGGKMALGCTLGEANKITITFGLPKVDFYTVAAHEYAHIWHYSQAHPCTDAEITEGFGQWVAAQVAKKKGLVKKVGEIDSHRGDVYATGYQRFKMMSNEQVLNVIRTSGRPASVQNPLLSSSKDAPTTASLSKK
jgi:hypothetical protein